MFQRAKQIVRKVLRFYVTCLFRAFHGKYWRVDRGTGVVSFSVASLNFLGFIPASWSDFANGLPILFFTIVFVLWFLGHLVAGPYLLYAEELDRANRLDEQQKPKLRISARDAVLDDGYTMETQGGSRQTVVSQSSQVVVLDVVNDGMETLTDCTCRVMGAWKMLEHGSERMALHGSVVLSWSRDLERPEFSADIEPSDTCVAYVAQLHPGGFAWIFRKLAGLPSEYHQMFGESGRYHVMLQFKSSLPNPLQLLVELNVLPSKQISGHVQRANYSFSILKQRAPRLLPQDFKE